MKTVFTRSLGILSLLLGCTLFGLSQQEKVIQIFQNGKVIQEYRTDEIDYIEVNDFIEAPTDLNASISENSIIIQWQAIEGCTYNLYRSGNNINFDLLASDLTKNSYVDEHPLNGTNYYKVKAITTNGESAYSETIALTPDVESMESGIYLGITGFNQTLYEYPVLQLTENSVEGFRDFVDGLTMKNGTVLYYSVDQALNTMQATELPSDISTAAIVTFTDGLDQGSFMMEGVYYDDEMEYLDALNHRIKNETVAGKPITAFSIGIRGQDVADINMFRTNLAKLAYDPKNPDKDANAFEVSNMSEVNAKFKEIAEKLTESNYVQTINLKMPGLSNGTRVRFTFDNVNAANNSQIYIEGKFNLKDKSLEEVEYVGLTSTSGSTVNGTVDGIFVNFTFDGVQTDNNVLIKSEFTDEWTYIASNNTWQINSEFDKTENSDIVTKRSSAVIMLVLDCSSSLANDFVKAQTNAKDFISTLYQAVGGSENPGDNEETIYSETPIDLSVSIWKDGKRYFLTQEQYKNANLTGAIIEGLTVLSNMGNFIISPETLYYRNQKVVNVRKYFSSLLPTKDQGTVISLRYREINQALKNSGFKEFSTGGSIYYTKTQYNSSYNYCINLYNYTGGALDYASGYGTLRGVSEIKPGEPIIWNPDNNLALSVIKDGQRYLTFSNSDLDQYDEIEGVYVSLGDQKFIVKLEDEYPYSMTKDTAMLLYKDVLPDKDQAIIMSLLSSDINSKLQYFGGSKLSTDEGMCYLTKTPYDSSRNWVIYWYSDTFLNGDLTYSSNGYVRGVLNISE